MVRAFKLSTGEFLWQHGNGSAGNLKDNKLYNPQDVELLPNGNVLITGYNGFVYDPDTDEEATGHGHSGLTGSLFKSRVIYKETAMVGSMEHRIHPERDTRRWPVIYQLIQQAPYGRMESSSVGIHRNL